jgi:carbonic anhydrase
MTQDLLDGVQAFKEYHYGEGNEVMKNLIEMGQDPKYFIISCIDSRCNPYTIFRAPPGLFFTHKAMGAIVRPYEKGTALAAALEFALEYNNIETIIVLGHTQCGAIKALAEGLENEEISKFVNVVQQALTKAQNKHDDQCDIISMTEKEAVLESVENLINYPSVAKALKNKKVDIKPWIFNMHTGNIEEFDKASNQFKVLMSEGNVVENRKS